MATKETYELAANNLASRIREAPTAERKMALMGALGNTRTAQYLATGEERTARLAENCYRAEEKFFHRAVLELK